MQTLSKRPSTCRITPFHLRAERRLSPRAYAIPESEIPAAVAYFRSCAWLDRPQRGPREYARLLVHSWSCDFFMVFYWSGLVITGRQGKGGAG